MDSRIEQRAAMRWLDRYVVAGTPRLQHFADVAVSLAKRDPELASYLRIGYGQSVRGRLGTGETAAVRS
jgi:hypothetical protein